MNSKQATQSLFDRKPVFQEALKQIAANGFFSAFGADVTGYEGLIGIVIIKGEGYIPSHERYMADGVKTFIDVDQVLANVTALIEQKQLRPKTVSCTVNTGDWQKCDSTGENVTGSKGSKITFCFSITFHLNGQRKKIKRSPSQYKDR